MIFDAEILVDLLSLKYGSIRSNTYGLFTLGDDRIISSIDLRIASSSDPRGKIEMFDLHPSRSAKWTKKVLYRRFPLAGEDSIDLIGALIVEGNGRARGGYQHVRLKGRNKEEHRCPDCGKELPLPPLTNLPLSQRGYKCVCGMIWETCPPQEFWVRAREQDEG